jgi:hypothetical protein
MVDAKDKFCHKLIDSKDSRGIEISSTPYPIGSDNLGTIVSVHEKIG